MPVQDLTVRIGSDISDLQAGINKASAQIKQFGQATKRTGVALTKSITAPLTALGGFALSTAADFETLRKSMDTLNGSVEEGGRNFERLKEFSAGTPFQLQDLAKAQNMLQGFGLSADEAFNSLSMIGDIAAISGGSIDGIGIAFGQAAAEGRLMTRDIRQLINQGVPAIKLLADTMGVAESEVLGLAEEGQISFGILQQAFRDATTEGGMFANGMEQQSNTLAGIWSTLKDNVSIALAELGQSIAETFNLKDTARNLIERIKQITTWFTSLSEEARSRLLKIVAAVGLLGPALTGLGLTITAVGTAIAALSSPIVLVTGGIIALAAAILYVRDNWDAVVERISDIGWWRNAIIDMIQFFLENNPFSYIIDGFNAVLEYLGRDQIGNVFDSASDSLEGLKGESKEFETQFKSIGETVKSVFSEFSGIDLNNMMGGGETGGGGVGTVISSMDIAKRKVTEFKSVFTEQMSEIGESSRVAAETIRVNAHRWPESLREAYARMQEMTFQITEAIKFGISDMVFTFVEGLGQMMAGTATLDQVFVGVLKSLADMAVKIGKIILLSGLGIEKLKLSLATFTGVGAIVAGAALIAIGSAAKAALGNVGRGGSSGGASVGSFEPSLRSEQQNVNVTGEFVAKGKNLVAVINNNSKVDNRVGRTVPLGG